VACVHVVERVFDLIATLRSLPQTAPFDSAQTPLQLKARKENVP
jgi:hypothetical protein